MRSNGSIFILDGYVIRYMSRMNRAEPARGDRDPRHVYVQKGIPCDSKLL